jgi:hypothetical protein
MGIFNREKLDNELLKAKTEAMARERCNALRQDIEVLNAENRRLGSLWFSFYIFVGIVGILSSSASTILTFSSDLNKSLLFTLAFISTTSASILTFLDPSRRATQRRQAVRRGYILLEKVKNECSFIGLNKDPELIHKVSIFAEQFAELLENSSK